VNEGAECEVQEWKREPEKESLFSLLSAFCLYFWLVPLRTTTQIVSNSNSKCWFSISL